MIRVQTMTKQVTVSRTGKVHGIKGLYKDLSSNRFYVRYSFHGVDKQLTVFPKNLTFSGLEKTASRGLTELRRRVMEAVGEAEPEMVLSPKDKISRAQDALVDAIEKHWAKRGSTQRHIVRLLRFTKGLCLCSTQKPKDKQLFNEHNHHVAMTMIENHEFSDGQRSQAYKSINNVFSELIHAEIHHGSNPAVALIKPKNVCESRTTELTFADVAAVIRYIRNDQTIDALKRIEAELFIRLCIETGQRPGDIHRWNVLNITPDKHYLFDNHKTSRKHRVAHLISDVSMNLAMTAIVMRGGTVEYPQSIGNKYRENDDYQSFWRLCPSAYGHYINSVIRNVVGEDKTLYCARHFFISEMFRMTDSELWAEVFTHEGRNVNQRHYLHVDQSRADALLKEMSKRLDEAIRIAIGE